MKETRFLITCEHGGNQVPVRYRELFRGARNSLAGHRGFDPGALELARTLSRRLAAPLVASTVTRLLVDLNRSPGHRRLFSPHTRGLDASEKQALLEKHYLPHRNRVERLVAERIAAGQAVIHVGVHTFSPELDGRQRNADIGLLYDPARAAERQFCTAWRAALLSRYPALRVRRNYPYLGKADGLTTLLRRRFTAAVYLGIELEVNSRWAHAPQDWRQLQRHLVDSLQAVFLRRGWRAVR